jgi:hypothetical protein
MIIKKDRKFLGLRNEPGRLRALLIAGGCAAFVLGALWYTVLTDNYGATSGPKHMLSSDQSTPVPAPGSARPGH